MKKLLSASVLLLLIGAGCASESPAPSDTSSDTTVDTSISASGTSVTPAPSSDATSGSSAATGSSSVDDSGWVATKTKSGITVKLPVKGAFAPMWTLTILAKDDPKLKDDCYVTADTKEQTTSDVPAFAGACHTSTGWSAESGTRIDYVVLKSDVTRLLMLSKDYKKGFDHDGYSAVVAKILADVQP